MRKVRRFMVVFLVAGQGCSAWEAGVAGESDWSSEDSVMADQDSTEKFATFADLSGTLLPQLDRAVDLQGTREIGYPFCVHSVGIQPNASTEADVLAWATRAMTTWIAPLQGQPGWRATRATAYDVPDSGGNCPQSYRGLPVYEIRLMDLDGADNAGFVMRMGSWGVQYLALLHELGHGLGLGDTYKTADFKPIGQPEATLNNQWGLKGVLTQDDIDGIRFVWARLRGDRRRCPSGYQVGQVRIDGELRDKSPWGDTYCIPADGNPGTVCTDTYEKQGRCSFWAASGECQRNPSFMLTACCASCKAVKPDPNPLCIDTYPRKDLCSKWAANNECSRNPDFMLSKCCGSCEAVGK